MQTQGCLWDFAEEQASSAKKALSPRLAGFGTHESASSASDTISVHGEAREPELARPVCGALVEGQGRVRNTRQGPGRGGSDCPVRLMGFSPGLICGRRGRECGCLRVTDGHSQERVSLGQQVGACRGRRTGVRVLSPLALRSLTFTWTELVENKSHES